MSSLLPERRLKLWLIIQRENRSRSSYSAAVVAADTHYGAIELIPGGGSWESSDWATSPRAVQSRCLGDAGPDVQAGVICVQRRADGDVWL